MQNLVPRLEDKNDAKEEHEEHEEGQIQCIQAQELNMGQKKVRNLKTNFRTYDFVIF